MKPAVILSFLLWAGGTAHAVDKINTEVFTESRNDALDDATAHSAHKSISDAEKSESSKFDMHIESARLTYEKYNNRVRVPGFISASPIPQVARVIGPVGVVSLRMGDTFFARWAGAPLPKPGDVYSTYTPAVVLQNMENPTDFEIFGAPDPSTKLPKNRRLAGYFYESSGRARVTKIKGGVVYCIMEQLSGQVKVGDQLMQQPPLVQGITPISSGLQLSAAVVSGSPVERLSTTRRSFLYLNRGSRDGIRVGRVFESIETVNLDEPIGGGSQELSNGEAIVIHVTDAYSTAMITKQFDVIRIGSLLRTKQDENPTERNSPFQDYVEIKPTNAKPEAKADLAQPEIPSLDKLPVSPDESLPEPRKRPSPPAASELSDLDQLEHSMKMQSLTPAEKARLSKLGQQAKLEEADKAEGDDLSDTPNGPTVDNSFKDGKKNAKKPAKKKAKNKNDEEELNLLMMQN